MHSDIPKGWRRARLGNVAEVVGGATPSRTKAEYWGGGIPWVVPSELSNLGGRYLTISKESITEKGKKAAGLRIIPPGSILLTSRATVGSTAINTIPVVTNQGFQNLVAKEGIHGLWLFYCVSAQQNALVRRASGSTFLEVSRSGVHSLPIVIPPLVEQRAIATVLDSIDETIEQNEVVINATERLREALRSDLLTHGLPNRHKEWKEIRRFGTVPALWQVSPLGDLCMKPTYGANAPSRPYDSSLPRYVRVTDITDDGRLRTDSLRSAEPKKVIGYELEGGDLLFARSGSVGRTYLYHPKDGQCVYAGYLIRFRPLPDKVLPEFLKHYTLSHFYRRWVNSVARRGAQTNINATEYCSLPVLLPTVPEQKTIARTLDSVDAVIETLRRKRCALNEVKASTTEALLTGRRRVTAVGRETC